MGDLERTWDQRILAAVPPSVDPTLIAESLHLTPTERLARLQAMVAFVDVARSHRDHPIPVALRDAERR